MNSYSPTLSREMNRRKSGEGGSPIGYEWLIKS